MHGWKRWKTFENHRKSTFSIMSMRDSWNKIPNEQPSFGCQTALGSHSQSQTNKLFSSFFFTSLSYAWWKRYFLWFSNVFHHFRPCKHMRKHVFAGQNTQQLSLYLNALGPRFNQLNDTWLFKNFSLKLKMFVFPILKLGMPSVINFVCLDVRTWLIAKSYERNP